MTAKISRSVQVLLICITFIFIVQSVFAQDDIPTPAATVVSSQITTEAEFVARLASRNPDAVGDFLLATEAQTAGDYELAQDHYLQVLQLAPDFTETLRRLSAIELKLGNIEAAIKYAENAVKQEPSATHKAALALALAKSHHRLDHKRALQLALDAATEIPSSGYVNIVLFEIAVQEENGDALRIASYNLVNIAPRNPLPHYFSGLAAAKDGNFEYAKWELQQAESLGMPADDVETAFAELSIEDNIKQDQQRQSLNRATSSVQFVALILLGVVIVLEFFRQKRKNSYR